MIVVALKVFTAIVLQAIIIVSVFVATAACDAEIGKVGRTMIGALLFMALGSAIITIILVAL